MDDLIQFLHKQLDQDERTAASYRKNITPDSWAGVSPAEVADGMDHAVAAGRRAIGVYEAGQINELALKIWAVPYAGRPGYRQEWQPV